MCPYFDHPFGNSKQTHFLADLFFELMLTWVSLHTEGHAHQPSVSQRWDHRLGWYRLQGCCQGLEWSCSGCTEKQSPRIDQVGNRLLSIWAGDRMEYALGVIARTGLFFQTWNDVDDIQVVRAIFDRVSLPGMQLAQSMLADCALTRLGHRINEREDPATNEWWRHHDVPLIGRCLKWALGIFQSNRL